MCSPLGKGVRERVGLSVGVFFARCTKSGGGPRWCGTKCRGLIWINSPARSPGPFAAQWGEHVRGDSLLFVIFPLAQTAHADSLGRRVLPLSDLPVSSWGWCVKSEQHHQKSVIASGHRLYFTRRSPALFLCLVHPYDLCIHTSAHRGLCNLPLAPVRRHL